MGYTSKEGTTPQLTQDYANGLKADSNHTKDGMKSPPGYAKYVILIVLFIIIVLIISAVVIARRKGGGINIFSS
jgi:hypothetical protein